MALYFTQRRFLPPLMSLTLAFPSGPFSGGLTLTASAITSLNGSGMCGLGLELVTLEWVCKVYNFGKGQRFSVPRFSVRSLPSIHFDCVKQQRRAKLARTEGLRTTQSILASFSVAGRN